MSELEKHIGYLFTAELQFRFASAVNLATSRGVQPLDVPIEWTHGAHRVRYEEIALRDDQAEYAAHFVHRASTYLMAVAIKDALEAVVPGLSKAVRTSQGVEDAVRNAFDNCAAKPWTIPTDDVATAYHVARLIRNAFAHAPWEPQWKIHPELRGIVFSIAHVITLSTDALHGTAFDWRHYGGPLALFQLCRLVRMKVLGHNPPPRTLVPMPSVRLYQQGGLILEEVDEIPAGAKRVQGPTDDDGTIDLGGGHTLHPGKK